MPVGPFDVAISGTREDAALAEFIKGAFIRCLHRKAFSITFNDARKYFPALFPQASWREHLSLSTGNPATWRKTPESLEKFWWTQRYGSV